MASLAWNPVEKRLLDPCDPHKEVEFTFDTLNSMQPTPVILRKDEKYRITVVEFKDWFDREHAATPDGLIGEPSAVQNWVSWTRRDSDPKTPWFKLMAAVGDSDYDHTWEIGAKGELRAYRDGRLYLFVNDTLGMYHNNKGTAKIRVRCLTR